MPHAEVAPAEIPHFVVSTIAVDVAITAIHRADCEESITKPNTASRDQFIQADVHVASPAANSYWQWDSQAMYNELEAASLTHHQPG
mmetsp:Transcript_80988/g.203845  ORF Transcript_80988/g.203845 Transcript_80988/m.203845 type:complete len:87 (-) Transcript_80988:769-1029(-)